MRLLPTSPVFRADPKEQRTNFESMWQEISRAVNENVPVPCMNNNTEVPFMKAGELRLLNDAGNLSLVYYDGSNKFFWDVDAVDRY